MGQLIKRFFVDEEQEMTLNKQALRDLTPLYNACDPPFQNQIWARLSDLSQREWLKSWPQESLVKAMIQVEDSATLHLIYKGIDPALQQEILGILAQYLPERYDALRDLLPNIKIQDGVIVESSPLVLSVIQIEVEGLLDACEDEKVPSVEAKVGQVIKRFSGEEQQLFLTAFMTGSQKIELTLTGPDKGGRMAKVYTVISAFLESFPELEPRLKDQVRKMTPHFQAIRDPLTLTKIVNRLPVPIIQMIWQEWSSFETQSTLEKRNIYSRLIQEITSQLDTESASNIQEAVLRL